MKTLEEWLYRLFFLWYLGGLLIVAFNMMPASVTWVNSVFLSLGALLAVIYFQKIYGVTTGGIIAVCIAGMTYFIQYFIVQAGGLFGNLLYTQKLPPVVEGVPLLIAAAWLLLISTTHAIVQQWDLPQKLQPLMGASLAVTLTVVVQVVGVELQFWQQHLQWQSLLLYMIAVFSVTAILHIFLAYIGYAKRHKWMLKMHFVYYALWVMFSFWALLHNAVTVVVVSATLLVVLMLVGKGITYGRSKKE